MRDIAGGRYVTPSLLPRQSTGTFHKIPLAHPRDSSGLSRSWTVVGKVAVEAVETAHLLHSLLLPFCTLASSLLQTYRW